MNWRRRSTRAGESCPPAGDLVRAVFDMRPHGSTRNLYISSLHKLVPRLFKSKTPPGQSVMALRARAWLMKRTAHRRVAPPHIVKMAQRDRISLYVLVNCQRHVPTAHGGSCRRLRHLVGWPRMRQPSEIPMISSNHRHSPPIT